MKSNNKFLGWKIDLKNFCQMMEKTGIARGKILGWKIGMKNSSWMAGGKNRISMKTF